MATIGKVRAVFTSSTSGLVSGVNQASMSMRRMEATVNSLRGRMTALVGMQGVQMFGSLMSQAYGFARSLVNLGQQQAEVIDKTSKLAARLGVTYGQLAGLQYAGDLAGVSMEQIGAAMTKADVAMVRAAGGSKAAQAAFATLGLSVADLQAMSPAERFQAITDAIASLPTTAQRSAAAVALFGRAGAELLPLFSGGAGAIREATAEAERFGLALTSAQGRDVEAMNDSFTKVQKAISGIVQQVVAYLSPSITAIATKFTDFVGSIGGSNIGKAIGDGILAGARYLAGVGDYLIKAVPAAWKYVQELGKYWGTIFEVGRRVFSFFAMVGRTIEAYFKVGGSILTGLIGRLLNAAGELAQVISGGTFGRGLEQAGESMMQTSTALWNESMDAFAATAINAGELLFGGDKPRRAGEEVAGPLTSLLDAAYAQAEQSAAAIDEAVAGAPPIQVDGQAAAEEIATAVEQASKQAVEGIDSRSAEGLKTMFRLMRGDTGNDVQEKQLDELKRIRQATEQQGQAPTLDFEVFELAGAAGA